MQGGVLEYAPPICGLGDGMTIGLALEQQDPAFNEEEEEEAGPTLDAGESFFSSDALACCLVQTTPAHAPRLELVDDAVPGESDAEEEPAVRKVQPLRRRGRRRRDHRRIVLNMFASKGNRGNAWGARSQ